MNSSPPLHPRELSRRIRAESGGVSFGGPVVRRRMPATAEDVAPARRVRKQLRCARRWSRRLPERLRKHPAGVDAEPAADAAEQETAEKFATQLFAEIRRHNRRWSCGEEAKLHQGDTLAAEKTDCTPLPRDLKPAGPMAQPRLTRGIRSNVLLTTGLVAGIKPEAGCWGKRAAGFHGRGEKKIVSLARRATGDAIVFTGEGQDSSPANPPVETNFISARPRVFPVYSPTPPSVAFVQ